MADEGLTDDQAKAIHVTSGLVAETILRIGQGDARLALTVFAATAVIVLHRVFEDQPGLDKYLAELPKYLHDGVAALTGDLRKGTKPNG